MSKKYTLPTIQELFDAGVHFGHQVRKWHPAMEKYIYTVKKDIHIIDLETTRDSLEVACEFLYEAAKEGKKIVFVGTKKQAKDVVKSEALRCGAKFVKERWLGGTITNFGEIKNNINKYLRFVKDRETGEFSHYTKKEKLLLDKEIAKLDDVIGGLVGLDDKPQVLFVIDAKRERTAIREALVFGLPVVAIIDTNSDPRDITYAIPGNDDAIMSIATMVRPIADAILSGYTEYEKNLQKSKIEPTVVKEEVKEDKA